MSMNPPNLTSLHEWIINKKAGFDILPAPEKQPFIYQKWNSAIIKRFVSYFTAAATRNSGNPFRMVRNKISLTLNYGPVRDHLKISFLMISEIKRINSEILKKHDFRENRSSFPSVRLILEVKFGDNPLTR